MKLKKKKEYEDICGEKCERMTDNERRAITERGDHMLFGVKHLKVDPREGDEQPHWQQWVQYLCGADPEYTDSGGIGLFPFAGGNVQLSIGDDAISCVLDVPEMMRYWVEYVTDYDEPKYIDQIALLSERLAAVVADLRKEQARRK